MRRRSTGYVAAKIRANTARRNGSDVVNMQQAKRDAARIMRWLEEDGDMYDWAHIVFLASALTHQMIDLPVTRENDEKLTKALFAAPGGSALVSTYDRAYDMAMRELGYSR